MSLVNLSRRGLLQSGSTLVIGFAFGCAPHLPPTDAYIQLGAASDAARSALNAWIEIAQTGIVTLRMGASEMGQGVYTALPMILAEELDADWAMVHVESAPADEAYRRSNVEYPGESQLTGGSMSVRGYWTELRVAGAAARTMLIEAGAGKMGVSAADCRTEKGYVICGDQRVSYGDLSADAAKLKAPSNPTLKDPSTFTLLGTSPQRLDLPAKTNGTATFGIDVRIDGMRYATIVRCPHHGGTLLSMDDADARKMPGVIDIFPIPGHEAIAVVADNTWQCFRAANAVKATWDPGAGKGVDDAYIDGVLTTAIASGGRNVESRGADPSGFTLDSTYDVPYLDHAPIEPMCATAWVRPERVDLWAPTQVQQMSKRNAVKLTGVPEDKVFVHTTFLGGGFGRKSFVDFTNQALLISQHIAAPVKLTWTRETCFAAGYYRPRARCRFQAKLGADGLPTDWSATIASQNIMAAFVPDIVLKTKVATGVVTDGVSDMPYDVPNVRIGYAMIDLPIQVGWWRSVHGSHNGFFIESFVDECAHAAGADPIEYRRKLLAKNPRHLAVFELAVKTAGPLAEGQHRGVAIFHSFGSTVAQVADVSVTDGQLRVHKVAAAVDCGVVVNPSIIEAQIQSAVGMGLSSMGEQISFVDGAAQQPNYYAYPLLRLSQMPEVSVAIVPSTESPGGVGEVGLPPLLGAVGNAIFAATGKRVRSLPLPDLSQAG